MSRHFCLHCHALTPTTGTPNTVEGMFVDDLTIEGYGRHADLSPEDWLEKHGQRAGRCPECGMITTDAAIQQSAEWKARVKALKAS